MDQPQRGPPVAEFIFHALMCVLYCIWFVLCFVLLCRVVLCCVVLGT